MPEIILAKNFSNRSDLEKYITAEIGNDIPKNRESSGYIIKGKRKELKKLHLTDRTTIYGIKCLITDTPTKNLIKVVKKVKRRKKHV